MDEPRVLSIVPYQVLPARLGGEKGIALFNQYLGKKLELVVISTKNNEARYAENYTILPELSVSRIRYINIALYFRLRRLIREHKISHLLIEHPYYGWLAWLIRRTSSVQWVVHSHNIEFMRSRSIGRWWWKGLKWYERLIYKLSDINFFISDDDREFAIRKMGISAEKSYAITYGIEQDQIPLDIEEARTRIQSLYGITNTCKIFLFNGALYHHTNYDALRVILDEINPLLLQQNDFDYRIIVCGKGLPAGFDELKEYEGKKVIYAGFVEDISMYFKAADLFFNPIKSGGGVKTKAIEAIAYNCTVISYKLGALGLNRAACGKKLIVIEDDDVRKFVDAVMRSAQNQNDTQQAFYSHYSWEGITDKVKKILEQHA